MPIPPFKAALSHKPGKILNWKWGNGREGFEDREPSEIASHEIATIILSSDGKRILAISPDGTTTLSIQPNSSLQIREGTVDDKYERAFIYGNKYLSYVAHGDEDVKRVFTLYDPITKAQYPFQVESGGGGGGGSIVRPIRVRNLDFVDDTDQIVKMRAITGFTFWPDFIKKEFNKLEEYVGRAREMRFNAIRYFGCWGNINFKPIDIAGNYVVLQEADEWLNARGMRSFGTCFTDQIDGSQVLMLPGEQSMHFIEFARALKMNKTGWFEFVNEYRKNWKQPYPIQFNRSVLEGLVSTISTWYDGHDPEEQGEYLDYVTKHVGFDGDEWARKSKVVFEAQQQGLGDYPAARKPCIVGERTRIGEGSLPNEHAENMGIAELLGSGGCAHGGFNSLPQAANHESDLQNCSFHNMRGNAMECLQAISSMLDIIPPDIASRGAYSNGPGNGVLEHDDNRMLRTYVMTIGNRAYAIRCQGRKSGMPANPINDWRIINKQGYGECFVTLER